MNKPSKRGEIGTNLNGSKDVYPAKVTKGGRSPFGSIGPLDAGSWGKDRRCTWQTRSISFSGWRIRKRGDPACFSLVLSPFPLIS